MRWEESYCLFSWLCSTSFIHTVHEVCTSWDHAGISGSVALWQWAAWLCQTLHHKQKHTYMHTNRHKLVWGCPGVLENPSWGDWRALVWTDSSTLHAFCKYHAGGGFFSIISYLYEALQLFYQPFSMQVLVKDKNVENTAHGGTRKTPKLRSEGIPRNTLSSSRINETKIKRNGVFSLSEGHLCNLFSQRATAVVRLALAFKPRVPTHTEAIMRLFLPEASLQSLPTRPQEMEFSKRIKTSWEL